MSPVFNEEKYRALQEKLEIFENPLKCVQQSSSIFRLDSSFFDQKLINLEQKVKSMSHFFIESSNVVSGPFGSMLKSDAYQATGIPFIRIENIKDGFYINNSDIIYISPADNERIKNSELSQGDIVLSKVGNTIGFYAEVNEDIGVCNISENNIGIKLTGFTDSKKAIILTYLNTHIAKSLTLRRISGNAQPKLNVGDVCEIPIPIFNTEFEKTIEFFLQKSKKNRKDAINSYSVAEHLLLQDLGLIAWQPDDESVATKTFADFRSSGRLDAEYYQPKYDEYLAKVKSYSGGVSTLANHFEQNKATTTFSLPQYNYIEIGDINVGNGEASFNLVQTEELPANAKYVIQQGDILISKVRPYRGAVSIIDFEPQNVIASGAFTILRENGAIRKEVLSTLLRIPLYKDWLLKWNVGSSYPVIKDEDILNLTIPVIKQEIQDQIAEKVQESFTLRKESKRLLDLAKHAVEVAIEQGEDAAMKLLEDMKNG